MKRLMYSMAATFLLLSNILFAQLLIRGVGRGTVQAAAFSGLITFVNTGACPAGTTEVAGFNGKTLFGTINSNTDVGNTGGSDSITATTASVTQPTISAITMSGALANESAHTHSVTSNVTVADHSSHTHTYTEVPNHVHLLTAFPTATGGSSGFTVDTSMSGTPANNSLNTANPTGGVASGTTNGPSATLTHSPTNNAVTSAAGSAHTHGLGSLAASTPTASGTAITMNSFDNRSAYVKYIACKID